MSTLQTNHPWLLTAALAATLAGMPAAPTAQLSGLSESDEIELGRQAAAEVEQELTLIEAEAVTSYIAGLGQKFALRSGRPNLTYRFRVVDAAEINAFALPSGFILGSSFSTNYVHHPFLGVLRDAAR